MREKYTQKWGTTKRFNNWKKVQSRSVTKNFQRTATRARTSGTLKLILPGNKSTSGADHRHCQHYAVLSGTISTNRTKCVHTRQGEQGYTSQHINSQILTFRTSGRPWDPGPWALPDLQSVWWVVHTSPTPGQSCQRSGQILLCFTGRIYWSRRDAQVLTVTFRRQLSLY